MPRSEDEIGKAARPTRRKQANHAPAPNPPVPASSPIEPTAKPVRRKHASLTSTPMLGTHASAPIGPASNGEAGGDGQHGDDTQTAYVISAIVLHLRSLGRTRTICIEAVNANNARVGSLLRDAMGFRECSTETQRKTVSNAAMAHRLAVEKGNEGQTSLDAQWTVALASLRPIILANALSRQPWIDKRAEIEHEMEKLAQRLFVEPFVASVRGFGGLGMAVVVAEAGLPLGDYRTVSGLWKRLGYAVVNGRRQRRVRGKEAAEDHKYSAARQGRVWSFLHDSLLRSQWRGDKDADGADPKKSGKPVAVAAHAIGPYGEVYGRRRVHTARRVEATADLATDDPAKWTLTRCKNDAMRVMAKALLRDLWRVWRGMPPLGAGSTT